MTSSRLPRLGVFALAIAPILAVTVLLAQAQSVQVQVASASVRLEPKTTSPVIATVPMGAVLELVATAGDWHQVKLPKDASGFERVGYVRQSDTRLITVGGGAAVAAPKPAPGEPAARTGRPTVAVLDFDFSAVQKWWEGNWDIGKGVSDLMVDELLASGQLRLIERKRLEQVMAEQNLAQTNRADVSAKNAAAIGRLLGVSYFITGSITKFGGEEKNIGGGGVGGGILGGLGLKQTYANVSLTCRVIDATTAEILASARSDGQSKRKGILLGGGGKGVGGVFNMNSKDFRDTILGEATELAVKDAAAKLVAGIGRIGG